MVNEIDQERQTTATSRDLNTVIKGVFLSSRDTSKIIEPTLLILDRRAAGTWTAVGATGRRVKILTFPLHD